MPDPESKRKWDAKYTRTISVKFMRKTDQDVIEYIEGQNRRNLFCAAIREYMKNHPKGEEQ